MSAGECQTKNKKEYDDKEDEKPIKALDEGINIVPNDACVIYCILYIV